MAAISLRDAVLEDAAQIARIHVESWRAAYRGLIADAELDARTVAGQTVIWQEILGQAVPVLLALDDDTVLGFCALRREGESDPAHPEIGALYLDPAVFRRGIGTALLVETVARLRAAGDPEVTLWVLEGNHRARAFYARHGFVLTGERDHWHGASELRMRLSLTS
jgi:ribosomal protein S18 acetylase RimI-like enzyme